MPRTLRDVRDEFLAQVAQSLDKVIAGYETPTQASDRGALYAGDVSRVQAKIEAEIALSFHGTRVRIITVPAIELNPAPAEAADEAQADTDPSPRASEGSAS